MKLPRFDIDLDKHYKATVVIACPQCSHQTRQHLASMAPDQPLRCSCGADISMPGSALAAARQQADAIKAAYHVR
ncbi:MULTISPECIES: hypothetical protein [Vogesella]|jgi:hypothetical protein|uniref:Uncharacterized protein n=3 Tax=Vogesella TaxID=57739 RepID=A0ABT5HZZ5_VOGIN|nr:MULTISPECIES: hypothetical protein [Vogesella]MDC7689492.1 hypothetical protein [Vogesella indigofera]MDC7713374.1 hypothetical protein [Vogesella margarita]GGX86743.1 hypothetical protein GCM10011290_13310 [Vogesella alkaliphila]